MNKAVYFFPNSNNLFFEDQEKENWSANFIGWMDLTEEQILYGEFRKNPTPHISLESQKYYIYKRDDLEYNRKRVYERIHSYRDELLAKDAELPWEYDGRQFDGNGRAKENIKGLKDTLADIPTEQKSALFPQNWRDFGNQNYSIATEEDFNLFYLSFMMFRLDFERNVNQKTFDLKDQLNVCLSLEEVLQIEAQIPKIGHA